MTDPECFFVQDDYVLGSGDIELNQIFIRNVDGTYRKASGADLGLLMERAPGFVERVLDKHRPEGWDW
ncbi:MAG: hypothetical protein K2X59_04430 [Sphingomonas sp.]|nr:hypothetical protein [Sphingomonas sp.]